MASTLNTKSMASSPAIQMEFYKNALNTFMTQPEKCVLNMDSSRDIFWNVDYHSIYQKQSYSKVKRRYVYSCPICQKQFMSLFYLDLHIHDHHHVNDLMQNTTKMTDFICPAQDICSILGTTTTCHVEALKNEPYYTRGDLVDFANVVSGIQSDGITNSKHDMTLAKATKRMYQRQIMDMPCNEQELAERRKRCLEAMEDCFGGENDPLKDKSGGNLLSDMQKILCEVKSCQDHLGDILGDFRNVYDESSFHLLKHGWEHYMNDVYVHDMKAGVGFVFLVILLGFYIAIVNGWCFCTNSSCDRWFVKRRRRTFDHNRRNAKKLD